MIKTRVLLCEDEEDAREILSFYLNTIFSEVVVAEDGLEGLNIYKESLKNSNSFDLVLTDIKMPNLDGLQMLEEIYALNSKQKFIIVSAYKDEDMLLKSIDLKVLGYFVKPLNIDNVMSMLKKAKDEVLQERDEELVKINKIYSYNIKERLLYEEGKVVKLSKREAQALFTLMKNRGKIVSNSSLKENIWSDSNKLDSTLRTVIKRLKDKINRADFITSHKGQGYMIE